MELINPGIAQLHAFAGFNESHCICTHGSWPEDPAGERAAETKVSSGFFRCSHTHEAYLNENYQIKW